MRAALLLLTIAGCAHAQEAHAPLKGALTVCVQEAKDTSRPVSAGANASMVPRLALVDVGTHECRVESSATTLHATWSTCCYFGIVRSTQEVNIRILDRGIFIDALVGHAAVRATDEGVRWLPLMSHGEARGSVKIDLRFAPSGSDALALRALSAFAGPAATESALLALKPAFTEQIYEYSISVDEPVHALTLQATAATHCHVDRRLGKRLCTDPRVTIEPLGAPLLPAGMATVPLQVGRNTVHIGLSDEGGGGTKAASTYVLHVHREAANDALLRALFIDGLDLSPPFHPATTDYSAAVPFEVGALAVHAQTRSAFAAINGLQAHGQPTTNTWELVVGANVLLLDVAAQDGLTHRRYSLLVERAAQSSGGGDAGLPRSERGPERFEVVVDGAPVPGDPLAVRRMVVHALAADGGEAASSGLGGAGVLEQPQQRENTPSVFEARVGADVGAVSVLLEMSGGVRATEELTANGVPIREFGQQSWPLQTGENVLQILVASGKRAQGLSALHEPQLFALIVSREARASGGGSGSAGGPDGAAGGEHDAAPSVGRHRSHASLGASTIAPGGRYAQPAGAQHRWQPGDVLGIVAALVIAVSAIYLAIVNQDELARWAERSLTVLQKPPDSRAARLHRPLSQRADWGDDDDGAGGELELGAHPKRSEQPRRPSATSTWTEGAALTAMRSGAPLLGTQVAPRVGDVVGSHNRPPPYEARAERGTPWGAGRGEPAAAEAPLRNRRVSDDGLL